MAQIWDYNEDFDRDADIVGFKIEATDGSIGKIDEATYDAGSSYVVVDTGPWILGRKVLLPAGVIAAIDYDDEVVRVSRSKDEIKASPEFNETHDHREFPSRQPYEDYYQGL